MITLDLANRIAVAAFAEGKMRGLANMSVVVTDASGAIRLAMRGDGVGTFGVDIAKGKAATALGFNVSSLKLGEWFGQNGAATAGLSAVTGGQFLPLGGGVVVRDEARAVIGAAAVAGGAPETDHAVIVAAVVSAGLVAAD
jgi:glc operon protein GlcG